MDEQAIIRRYAQQGWLFQPTHPVRGATADFAKSLHKIRKIKTNDFNLRTYSVIYRKKSVFPLLCAVTTVRTSLRICDSLRLALQHQHPLRIIP